MEKNVPRVPHSSQHGNESDSSLLRRFERGEEDAATAIYLRYAKRIELLARTKIGRELLVRVEPDDIVQSVFRTFFRRAVKGHYDVPEGEELWKLLLVISLNKIRALGQYHGAAKRDVKQTISLAAVEPPAKADDPTETAYNILRLTVNELLDELPETHRRIVALRIDGHVVQQIADETKRSKRSVERVLQGFQRRLRAHLEEE